MTEQALSLQPQAPNRRRQLLSGVLYLGLMMAAVFLVLPQFLGQDRDRVVPLLQTAPAHLLALALALETARYVCFGLVARRLAGMLGRPVARADTAQMMLASYALSRIFSLGGAMAFIVRMQFFLRHGLSAGRTLALFITHNTVSAVALMTTYLVGVGVLWTSGALEGGRLWLALGWLVVVLGAAGLQAAIGLHPGLLEQQFQRTVAGARARAPFLQAHALAVGGLTTFALFAAGLWWWTRAQPGVEQIVATVWTVFFAAMVMVHIVIALNGRLRRTLRVALARRAPMALRAGWFHPETSRRFAGELASGTRATFGNRRGLAGAFALQAAGLACDIAALLVVAQALQLPLPPPLVVAAYIIAYYAQLIAPTPGEAGAMEFALLGVLVGLGVTPLEATTTTLLFRFISFWLPIPVGVLGYFNLRRLGRI